MNYEQLSKLIESLSEFVIRVSKGDATPAEIAALPEVAKALMNAPCSPTNNYIRSQDL